MSCVSPPPGYWSVTVFGRKHCYRLYSEHLNEAVRWVCAVQKVIDSKAPVQTPTQLLMRDVEVGPRHRGGGHGGILHELGRAAPLQPLLSLRRSTAAAPRSWSRFTAATPSCATPAARSTPPCCPSPTAAWTKAVSGWVGGGPWGAKPCRCRGPRGAKRCRCSGEGRVLSRSGRSWVGSEPLHVMGTVPGCWGRFGEPKIVAVNTPSPSCPVPSCSPRSPQLHHAARRGREALQLAAAAGIAAGPGAADPGHPADLPGPAAAGGRDLLPAGEADHGAAGAGRAGRLALLAAAHLHELHVPALPACPALPALPPGQASATELAGFPPGLVRGSRHCCDPPFPLTLVSPPPAGRRAASLPRRWPSTPASSGRRWARRGAGSACRPWRRSWC